MAFLFNMLLEQAGIVFGDVLLLRHADKSALKGRTPFELWRDDLPAFDTHQATQSLKNRAMFSNAPCWASFAATPQGDTVFLGLYTSQYFGVLEQDQARPHNSGTDKAGECDRYNLQLSPKLSEYAGRLSIDWGSGYLAWKQQASSHNKQVVELRRTAVDDPFPGYMHFVEPLSRIAVLPHSWRTALSATRGVYLLTCARTREQYVGQADGADGSLGRWRHYVANMHGGNVQLQSREPSDYQVSILEVAGSSTTAHELSRMEQQWMVKLQSKSMGLN